MGRINIANNVKLIGEKNFKGKDKMIDYFIIRPGKEKAYAFSKKYTHHTYDLCKSGVSINSLLSVKRRDFGIMRLVEYLNFIMPYLTDYLELQKAA